jgi:hypothetical protein
VGSDVLWLNIPEERDRAAKAAFIFDSGASIDTALKRARLLGVGYIFIDKDWPGFQAWSGNGAAVPINSIVMDNESLLLLRTSDEG